MRFEWDPLKADANLRTHGIGFAEAVTVLQDAFALTREDPDAVEEQRFVTGGRRSSMRKIAAEPYRNIDFSRGKRGSVIRPAPGKAKISIRLDNTVLVYFRTLVDKAGGGNYQTLINDALLEHVHRRSALDVVRQVVREELAPYQTIRRRARRRSTSSGR